MQCPDDAPVAAAPSAASSDAAGWWLLGLAVAIIVIDVVLYRTGHPTMSQWLRRKTHGRRWWRVFGMSIIGGLLWHLFFGGPL